MKIICGLSELLPVKNVAGIISAIAKVPNVNLEIVGDGQERKRLENLAKNFKISNRVQFSGRVPNNIARQKLRRSDIFVLNSFHEGMPHALLEALSENVPIIATKIPAVEEILQDNVTGLIVKIDDSNDLAKKILHLSRDQALRKCLSENGNSLFMKKFTWDSHLEKLLAIFKGYEGNIKN